MKAAALRTVLAFLALPGVVAFLAPLFLARSAVAEGSFTWWALAFLLPGMGLLTWCVREFHVRGKGTLAPWDPPRHLVASGLYAISRNPMYVAVTLILLGWAIAFSSTALLVYALVVLAAFHLRVVYGEEPVLARKYREAWTPYSARVPRWLFRNRRAVLIAWLVAAVLVPATLLLVESYVDTRAFDEFLPPGTLVDVGGRRLHLLCIGTGEPTIFFVPSGWGTSVSSAQARDRLATRATVCSYDRAGTGWSDPGPAVMSADHLARDLAVLQDRAALRAPYVVVASSIGGLTAEMFARQFPERVAGLVLLDAAHSGLLVPRPSGLRWATPASCAAAGLAYLGVIRRADPFGFASLPPDEARQASALTYNARPWTTLCAIARGLTQTVRDFDEAPPLPATLPLTVLSAATTEELMPAAAKRFVNVDEVQAALQASHEQLAMASTRGVWRVVPDSTHLIASSQPDAVVEAVYQVLDAMRGRRYD